MTKFTIYKITNLLDSKVYIGKHKCNCNPCKYMGSGKLLKRAIKKYGVDQFTKEILFVFETEQEMNVKEAELVNETFTNSQSTYNLCAGGQGGFGFINANTSLRTSKNRVARERANLAGASEKAKSALIECRKDAEWLANWKQTMSESKKGTYIGTENSMYGKQHSLESKQQIGLANSLRQQGSGNSQFGSMWITNGSENRKVKKDVDVIPEGWYRGRTKIAVVAQLDRASAS